MDNATNLHKTIACYRLHFVMFTSSLHALFNKYVFRDFIVSCIKNFCYVCNYKIVQNKHDHVVAIFLFKTGGTLASLMKTGVNPLSPPPPPPFPHPIPEERPKLKETLCLFRGTHFYGNTFINQLLVAAKPPLKYTISCRV